MDSQNGVATESLYDLGWDQGSLFYSTAVCLSWNDLAEDNTGPLVLKHRTPDADDLFVVVTQTCDIVREVDDEPHVEAFLCRKALEGASLADIERNSPRLFVIDP